MIPFCVWAIEDESDREFMSALFEQYNRLMYAEIYKLVPDKWAADDLLQMTLLSLIGKIGELRKKEQHRMVNYIVTACKNKARNYLRDQKRHGEVGLEGIPEGLPACESSTPVEDYVIHETELDALAQIWSQLDERTQYLLEGYYILELTPEDMAEELHVKPASVRMLLSRARKRALNMLQRAL